MTSSRSAFLAALLGCAFFAGGCGFGGRQVPQDVQMLAEQGVALRIDWRIQVGGSELFGSDPFERGGVAVSEDGRTVVGTTSRGEVLAVAATGGDVLWRIEVAAEPFAAPPAIADGVVYVAAPDGSVRALYLESGGLIWSRRLGDVYHSAPTPAGDRVLVNSATGHLYALRADTGQVAWQVDRQPPGALTVSGGGRATVVGDVTYAGFPDGSLAAVDRSGELLWLADLAAGEDRLRDVDTTPLVVGGAVFAASFSGGLARVDATNGDLVWQVDLPGATSPRAVGDSLVTTTADGHVVWLDPETGATRAELELDGDASGVLVRWGEHFVLTEPHDGLYVLATSRPWIHTRFRPDSGFSNTAAAHGGWLWALSDGGFMYGIEAIALGPGM